MHDEEFLDQEKTLTLCVSSLSANLKVNVSGLKT